ncbi:MAG: ADP-L-glycero-D-mannoheptose-6-epimerase, partial [Chlamydiae bacterium CG10_big_fil_rev_8_21_14_0_10_35_9]
MKQDQIFTDQYIVVTGAAGFIGSGVVRHLNDHGLENLILV